MLTNSYRPPTNQDNIICGFKLVSPFFEPFNRLLLGVGNGKRSAPITSRCKRQNRIRNAFAALQDNFTTWEARAGFGSVDGSNCTDFYRPIAIDEQFIVRDESSVFETIEVCDDHANTGYKMDIVWSGCDEDEVVLGWMEFGREFFDDGDACRSATDDDDIVSGIGRRH